jgi:hypothetical protein
MHMRWNELYLSTLIDSALSAHEAQVTLGNTADKYDVTFDFKIPLPQLHNFR